MPITNIGLGTRSNPGRDRAISGARMINCYVEQVGPEGKLETPVYAADSFTSRATLTAGGACAGMLSLDANALYVVSGQKLFKNTLANATTDLGTVSNSGHVWMARNRKASTPQIGILTDSGAFRVLESDTLTVVSETFLSGLVWFLEFDGYGVLLKEDGEWYVSTSDEFTAWDELAFAVAENSPHGLVAGARRGTDLVLFGPRAMAFYANTGATDFPFERTATADLGCYAPRSVREMVIPGDGGTTDTVIWAATDADGAYVGIMAMSGYGGSKISTHAVDRAVRAESNISNIRAWSWAEGGHTFYALNIGSTVTWVYDTTTGQWHERASSGLSRYRLQHMASFAGTTVAGDYTSGVLYTMGPSVANALTSQLRVRSSNDNGDNWFTNNTLDIGGASERSKRFKFTRFGQSKEDGKLVEITVTNAVSENGTGVDMTVIPPHVHAWPNAMRMHALYVDLVPGSSGTSTPRALTGLAADVEAVVLA